MPKDTKRRSMGTKKLDVAAIRVSHGGNEIAEPPNFNARSSSALRSQQSSSRLPRPSKSSIGASGRSTSNERGRQSLKHRSSSSSLNQQNVMPTNFRTPRSTSRGWPSSGQKSGGSVRRPPMNSIQNSMAPRYSLAGNAGLNVNSGFGRSSAIGVKKDLMNDKEVQSQTQKDIVEFLTLHGYPRSEQLVSKKAFPLNSTEFRTVFTFLVRFLDPEFEDLEARTLHEKIPLVLRTIGYPAHVSKQTFQTLGTMHSWPSALAVLEFLLKRAKLAVLIMEQWEQIAFPNKDENGFENPGGESEELIRFDCFVSCYKTFNSGGDDYNDQLNDLEHRFWLREGLDPKGFNKQQRELKNIREKLNEEIASCEQTEQDFEKLKKVTKEKQGDLEKMQNYCAELEKHTTSKQKEIDALKGSVGGLTEKVDALKEQLSQLRNICKTVKNIDPDHVSPQIELNIELLEREVNEAKDIIKASDSSIWQGEMDLSKSIKEIQDVCRSFNEKLIDLGLYRSGDEHHSSFHSSFRSDQAFRLDPQVTLHEVKEFLREIERSLQNSEKRLHEEYRNVEKELYMATKEMERKHNELKETKEEMERRLNDKDMLQEQINQEESAYKNHLTTLKSNINTERSKDRKNLNNLETELVNLAKEEKDLLRQKNDTREEGQLLLTETPRKLLEKRKKQIESLNQKINEYKKHAAEKLQKIEKENNEMIGYVANLPKIKK